MVPPGKLLRLTALVVLPLATVAGVVPASAPLAIGLIVAFLLLATFDALRSADLLDAFSVTLPETIRLANGRSGSIAVQLGNETARSARVRFGLALPVGLTTPNETADLQLPDGASLATIDWPVIPQTRGRHRIAAAHLETSSPFGLWEVRRRFETRCDARVYPALLSERRAVAALFLNRGVNGAHAQRQLGRGREFEKLREYLPGDAVDDIHWKATAKRSHPVTKVFQIERTQEVYVLIDASRLSARESGSKPASPATSDLSPETATAIETATVETTLDRCLKAALLLGAAAERQGDLFGVVALDDQVRQFVRARNGRAHFAACRDALHALQPRPVSPDFEELCSFLRLRLRRRALLIILTSLDDPVLSESFVRGVQLIARQHLVVVVQPRPSGARPLFDNPAVETIGDVYAEFGGHLRWQNLRTLGQTLRRQGVGFSLADPGQLAAEAIRQYLDVKRRQIL